jgi:hypothetical protein
VVRMGRNAREWIASRHSLDRWLDRVETLVQEAVYSTPQLQTNGVFPASVCADVSIAGIENIALFHAVGETLSSLSCVI